MTKIETLDMTLNQKLKTLIIVCKDVQKKTKVGTQIILKMCFDKNGENTLSKETQNDLLSTYQKSASAYTEQLLMAHLDQKKITSYKRGTSYLLPNRFKRFYDKCVCFSAEGLNIYFTDLAISKFQKTIMALSERSKKDSLAFIKGKLESHEAYNLGINISNGLSFCRVRQASFIGSDDCYLGPKNTVYYEVNLNEDGTIDSGDVNNILELIELYAKVYGNFKYIKYNEEECIAYNNGSMQIIGTNLLPSAFEKTMKYMSKNN